MSTAAPSTGFDPGHHGKLSVYVDPGLFKMDLAWISSFDLCYSLHLVEKKKSCPEVEFILQFLIIMVLRSRRGHGRDCTVTRAPRYLVLPAKNSASLTSVSRHVVQQKGPRGTPGGGRGYERNW